MQRRVVVPSAITYTALSSACEKGKQLQKALQVFETMLKQGVLPNVIIYSALISACEKREQPRHTFCILEEMKRQHMVLNVITCNALISSCEKDKKLELAVQVHSARRGQAVRWHRT